MLQKLMMLTEMSTSLSDCYRLTSLLSVLKSSERTQLERDKRELAKNETQSKKFSTWNSVNLKDKLQLKLTVDGT